MACDRIGKEMTEVVEGLGTTLGTCSGVIRPRR